MLNIAVKIGYDYPFFDKDLHDQYKNSKQTKKIVFDFITRFLLLM